MLVHTEGGTGHDFDKGTPNMAPLKLQTSFSQRSAAGTAASPAANNMDKTPGVSRTPVTLSASSVTRVRSEDKMGRRDDVPAGQEGSVKRAAAAIEKAGRNVTADRAHDDGKALNVGHSPGVKDTEAARKEARDKVKGTLLSAVMNWRATSEEASPQHDHQSAEKQKPKAGADMKQAETPPRPDAGTIRNVVMQRRASPEDSVHKDVLGGIPAAARKETVDRWRAAGWHRDSNSDDSEFEGRTRSRSLESTVRVRHLKSPRDVDKKSSGETAAPPADRERSAQKAATTFQEKRSASLEINRTPRNEPPRTSGVSELEQSRAKGDDRQAPGKHMTRDQDAKKDSRNPGSHSKNSSFGGEKRLVPGAGDDRRNVSWGSVVAALSGGLQQDAEGQSAGQDRARRYEKELRELDDL
jgi:hypothetical protein